MIAEEVLGWPNGKDPLVEEVRVVPVDVLDWPNGKPALDDPREVLGAAAVSDPKTNTEELDSEDAGVGAAENGVVGDEPKVNTEEDDEDSAELVAGAEKPNGAEVLGVKENADWDEVP